MTSAEVLCGLIGYELRAILALQLPEEAYPPGAQDCIELRSFKKTLLVALLDGLSALRYPGRSDENRQRVIDLLREHGGWVEGELVSVPILKSRLDDAAVGTALLPRLMEQLGGAQVVANGEVAVEALDLPIYQLEELAENDRERKLIQASQHYSLLYAYRNFLLHEFRSPDLDFLQDSTDKPYYLLAQASPHLSLIYPLGFFIRLANNCLDSVREYWVSSQIDPYERLSGTQGWGKVTGRRTTASTGRPAPPSAR